MNLIMVLFQAGSLEVFKIGGKPGIYWKNKDYPMGRGAFLTREAAMDDYYKTTNEGVADAVLNHNKYVVPGLKEALDVISPPIQPPNGDLILVDFVNKRRVS